MRQTIILLLFALVSLAPAACLGADCARPYQFKPGDPAPIIGSCTVDAAGRIGVATAVTGHADAHVSIVARHYLPGWVTPRGRDVPPRWLVIYSITQRPSAALVAGVAEVDVL